MDFEDKALCLYEYIVGGIPTAKMAAHVRSKYGIYIDYDEFNYVLPEYDINYPDRNTNVSGGFKGGYHRGRYRNGYRAADGLVYQIDPDIIMDYMDNYNRRDMNLEEYLEERFRRAQPPVQAPSYSATPQAPAVADFTYAGQTPEDGSDLPEQVEGSRLSELAAKLVPAAAVAAAAAIIGYNLLLGGNRSDTVSGGVPAVSTHEYVTDKDDYIMPPTNEDGTVTLFLMVTFVSEKSDMAGVEDYYFCSGTDANRTKLTPGESISGTIDVPVGTVSSVWVVSGDVKSEEYSIEIGYYGGSVYFDCRVGADGRPELVSTQVLASNIWVEKL